MKILNENFMESSISEARKGLLTLSKTNLFPGMVIYRFADTTRPQRYYTGPWWISLTPFESLKKYADIRGQPLKSAARQCLAVNMRWSNMDILLKVRVKERLSAWSGTPRTQAVKIEAKYSGMNLKPDRDITQLFIPGLNEADPDNSKRKIWERAFFAAFKFYLS